MRQAARCLKMIPIEISDRVMVVHSDYLDGASGLAHLPWRYWQWCVTESREILKEKKKKLDICGSLLLEEENKKGNGRWRGSGKGIEMA